jgi:trigger factor
VPEPLSVVTERLPKSQVGMTIEVPAEVVNATYDRVLNRLASRAKIEGFRPGKAPRALVEARIGPAVLREEVVETMVPEVVRQALDEKSIDPIDNPDVEVLELERGRPARLKATISVMPEVTLADVTKLKVEPPDHTHEVTDEMHRHRGRGRWPGRGVRDAQVDRRRGERRRAASGAHRGAARHLRR